MAILDHFGYQAQSLRDHDDPLWFNKDGFLPWLEHVRDTRILHLIRDPSVERDINKKLSVTGKKIESKMKSEIKVEKREGSPDPSATSSKRKSRSKKDSGKGSKKSKVPKGVPYASSTESEPEPEISTGTKSRPTTGGKSPRVHHKSLPKGGSDIDTSSSETEGQ